jgi:uncharacterized membrane protein YjjP (DUF1212 family)
VVEQTAVDSHESTTEYVARIRRQLRRERRWSVVLVVLAYVVVAGGVAAVKLAAGDGWGESVGAGVVGVLVATLIVMRLATLGDPGPLDRP